MKPTATHMVVTTTCDSPQVRDAITRTLLKSKLASCIQVSQVKSHYRWEGKITHAAEFLLTIKTRKALLKKVEAAIVANHTYTTPQIVAWTLSAGHAPYLKWIDETTRA